MVIDGFLDRSQITGYPEVDFEPPEKSGISVSSRPGANRRIELTEIPVFKHFVDRPRCEGLLPDSRQSTQNRPDVVRVSNEHPWPLGLNGGWCIGD